jgi:predicted SPOUT superfamily RNA methylase MTH1
MKELSIAIPASVVSDTPHLREKTSKVGLIGRTAAIFRVGEIIIYPDGPLEKLADEMNLIATLLAYIETPQYLRKRLFKLEPQLQYAGILPPLRTPHHPLDRRSRDLKVGEYREGVVLSRIKEGALIDIGVEKPALARNAQLVVGKRVTVRIVNGGEHLEAELANRDEVSAYWGYRVTVEERSLGKMLKARDFRLTIGTSQYGVPFAQIAGRIAEKWGQVGNVLVAFGAPAAGLNEIVAQEGFSLDDIVDFVVNTIPMQGTETVRTEEALIASLAVLNVALVAEH